MKTALAITSIFIATASWAGDGPKKSLSLENQHEEEIAAKSSERPIGSAKMLPDRSIVLNLRAETGAILGEAIFQYTENDPQYAEILRHVGGLRPGEEKLVPPFPSASK